MDELVGELLARCSELRIPEEIRELIAIVHSHNRWRRLETINLIASENVMSPLAELFYINDMMSRYAEGLPRRRYYQGTKYIDEVEERLINIMSRIFRAKYVDVRPISGTIANLAVYHAVMPEGGVMASIPVSCGGHISHNQVGGPSLLKIRVIPLPWNMEEFNVDVDGARRVVAESKPKLIVLGASLYLFPHPISELLEVAEEHGSTLLHDSAHVLGLIAGRRFPNPLELGAPIMTSSTHKTFPGPQGGVIMCNDEELFEKVRKAVFPGLTSNYHHHRYISTAITALEMEKFGEAYAEQVLRNARRLAEALHARGFDVVAERLGFTRTHQVVIDVSKHGGGAKVSAKLEEANIIVNSNALPWDKSFSKASGVRMGVQEVTRFGMREDEMEVIADFISDVVIKGVDPSKVRQKVVEFRRGFVEVKYCFEIPREFMDEISKIGLAYLITPGA